MANKKRPKELQNKGLIKKKSKTIKPKYEICLYISKLK